jgi:hypothetical protein
MNYYYINRDDRIEYQKKYQELHHDKYLEYQKWYYQNVKKPGYVPKIRVKKVAIEKPTKITKGFLKELERLCKRKIKDYNATLYHEKQAILLTNHNKAFEGFDVVNGKFRLRF